MQRAYLPALTKEQIIGLFQQAHNREVSKVVPGKTIEPYAVPVALVRLLEEKINLAVNNQTVIFPEFPSDELLSEMAGEPVRRLTPTQRNAEVSTYLRMVAWCRANIAQEIISR